MATSDNQNKFEIFQEEKEEQTVVSDSLPVAVLEEVIDSEVVGEHTATCKWFNDKLGFGFVTICDGNEKGKDIFVHHSGIKPLNSIYKTLKKGEYINFNIVNGMNGLQAIDVTGINGGPLMCDHVIGKKVNDTSSPQQEVYPQYSQSQPPNLHPQPNQPNQWHSVMNNNRRVTQKQVYPNMPPPPYPSQHMYPSQPMPPPPPHAPTPPPYGRQDKPKSASTAAPKRYPPNTRPYKNKKTTVV